MRHITLALEYFHPWPNSLGFYVARSLGWFAEIGIDLELRTTDPGRGDALAHLARGEVEFGVFPTNRLLVRRESGDALVAVAAVNQRGLETIRTPVSSGITRLRELQGARIAYNPTPRGHAMVRSLIANDGGDPDDYTVVDVGARELDPATGFDGLADASFGSYWAWDNLFTSLPPRDERVWRVDDALRLPYHSYLLGTSEAVVTKDSGLVADLLSVAERGFRRAAAEQEEAAETFATVAPYFAPAIVRRSLDLIAPTWFHDDQWGIIREPLMSGYAAWLARHGILTEPQAWREAVAADDRVTGVAWSA